MIIKLCDLRVGYVEEYHFRGHVSNAEALDLKVRPVVGEAAQELICRRFQTLHVFRGNLL